MPTPPAISIQWDSAPVRTAFGDCQIVASGVAVVVTLVATGAAVQSRSTTYRVHGYATRGARKPEITLAYLGARAGVEVREGHLPTVRAAALESWSAVIAPLRAEIVAEARARLRAEGPALNAAAWDFVRNGSRKAAVAEVDTADLESSVADVGQDMTRDEPAGEPVQPTPAEIDAEFPGWRERDDAAALEAARVSRVIAEACARGACDADELAPFEDFRVERERRRLAGLPPRTLADAPPARVIPGTRAPWRAPRDPLRAALVAEGRGYAAALVALTSDPANGPADTFGARVDEWRNRLADYRERLAFYWRNRRPPAALRYLPR